MHVILTPIILMFRVLIGIFSRLKWLKNQILKLFLAVASAYIAFAFVAFPTHNYLTFFLDFSNYGIATETLAVMLLVFSMVEFFSIITTTIVFEKLPLLKAIDLGNQNEPFCVNEYGDQAIVFNRPVNLRLESASNPVAYNSTMFQVHPLIIEMLPTFLFKMPETGIDTSDDLKIRLNSDFSEDSLRKNTVIQLQKTSYYRDRLSNTLANYRVRKDGRLIFELRTTEVLTAQKHFFDLRESKLSNQLGGSVILLTSDSTILFLRQGNRAAENSGKLAPAGSGSFDPRKPIEFENLTFQEYARQEVARELREECGLLRDDIHNIQICGFGRYLYRNGKPEVFCIASTNRHSKSIKIPIKEWDFQQREIETLSFPCGLNRGNVIAGLTDLIQKIDQQDGEFATASGPLYWNTLFAKQYLEQLDETNLAKLLSLTTTKR